MWDHCPVGEVGTCLARSFLNKSKELNVNWRINTPALPIEAHECGVVLEDKLEALVVGIGGGDHDWRELGARGEVGLNITSM